MSEPPEKRQKSDIPQSGVCEHWKVEKGKYESPAMVYAKKVISGKMVWIQFLKGSIIPPYPYESFSRLLVSHNVHETRFLEKRSDCLNSCNNSDLRKWLMDYIEVLHARGVNRACPSIWKDDLFKELSESGFAKHYPKIKEETYETILNTDPHPFFTNLYERAFIDHKNLAILLHARNKEVGCPFHHEFLPFKIFEIIITMSDLVFCPPVKKKQTFKG